MRLPAARETSLNNINLPTPNKMPQPDKRWVYLLKLKTPGSKLNLAYPCLGAYLATVKVREPQNCPPQAVDQAPEVISSVTEKQDFSTCTDTKHGTLYDNHSKSISNLHTSQSAADRLEQNIVKGNYQSFQNPGFHLATSFSRT
jgi:hypothetical protein